MITVIVCSRTDPADTLHERNVRKTASAEVEYLRFDNRIPSAGLCAVYNRGVELAQGDIVVFMHEDVFFMDTGWDAALMRSFADPRVGMVGIAGTQYLGPEAPGWAAAGRPFIRGKVVHETGGGENFHLTVFSWEKTDIEVVAVDGLFFAVRKSLFDRIRFDEATFDGFHFYDLDLCMQVRQTHRIVVNADIAVKHLSGGSFDAAWKGYALRFVGKYRGELPASCVPDAPDPAHRIPFESFDLRGRVKQETIG
jgi:GT2 family glycosyltransferase